ncbi:MAG: hypothetical protein HY974_00685 [Candidatus Kerfeldbacteria bacterium]|nr:hypothetical protein [Candidatus Kerfeldbacteria bacterium]
MGAIFVSCHSVTMPNTDSAGNSLALPITQSLNEPCCVVQGGNYGLHALPLTAITPTTLSLNNISIPGVASSPNWFQGKLMADAYTNQELYLGSLAEVPLYNYLKSFITQGRLQPQIYNNLQASV